MKSKLHDSGDRTAQSSDGERKRWVESLEHVLEHALKAQAHEQTPFLVDSLLDRLRAAGIRVPTTVSTPYINTIPVDQQPPFPGDWQTEVRIKSYIRWNAMAMVVIANRKHNGLGGHISTYASLATLYEVGYNHFFHAGDTHRPADMIFFQGHATPGNYARAYLERRLDERHLQNFRQDLKGVRKGSERGQS